jgi:hypothetical protein
LYNINYGITSIPESKANEVLADGMDVKRDFAGLEIDGETSTHRLTRVLVDWRSRNIFSASKITFWNCKVLFSRRSHGLHSRWGKHES